MAETIRAGTNVGTSGNDDLRTLYSDIATEITTIYSALSGLGGDDGLDNNGKVDNVTLDGGADNDGIYNTVSGGGASPSIVGGAGNDNIQNGYATDQLKANDATIDAGAGNDTVNNYGDNALINLGDGNDSLYNVGDKSTISAGAGNDTVSHFGDDSSIDGGAGNDYLGGGGSNVTVRGGAGNDSITTYGNSDGINSKILLDDTQGNNNFRISNSTNSTINAGSGNDTISADDTNEKLLIQAGAGNNSIVSQYGNGVTINAAGGNDTITIYDGSNFVVNAGDGANVIENSRVNDTTSSGHTITSGSGNDSIVNRVNNALITAGNGNNTVVNGAYGSGGGSNVTINTGSGNDFINNYYDSEHARGDKQENVIINSGAGNDTVTNITDKVTIDGGAGNDELSSYDSSNVSINGGAGADTIFIANGTVSGGAGNDSISAGNNVLIQYNSGDGNDAIWSFDANSTLSIGGGNYSSAVSGSDVVLTVGNSKITLSEAATLDTLNIVGTLSGGDTTSGGDVEVATSLVGAMLYRTEKGYPYIAEIAFNPTVYHGDEPTNYASKETWTITSSDGLELEGYHYTPENSNDKWVVIIHGYGHNHKHMYPFAGFYLANGYNVLMVDQRAAGESEGSWLTMGTAESADIALWTQEIARRNSDAKITLFGVSMGAATAMLAASRSDIKNVTSLVEDCGYSNVVDIINLFNSIIFQEDQETIDLMMPISESLTGYNLKDAAPIDYISKAKMPTLFITGSEDSVVAGSMLPALYNASGATVKEQFIVQGAGHGVAGLYDPVGYSNTTFRFLAEANGEGWATENAVDGISLRGTKYADTISNSGDNVTINTAAGNDQISLSADAQNVLIQYALGDGNDFIAGFNDDDTLNISGASYSSAVSGSNVVITAGGKITLEGAASLDNINITTNQDTTPSGEGVTINNTKSNTLVTGTAYADTITNSGKNVTVNALAGNDSITSKGSNVSIDAGAGNDSIYASGKNSTIDGGDGNNFVSVTGSQGLYVVFNGQTTVDGFNLGFGSGSDTVYIPGAPAGVDFRSGILTFYDDSNALVLSDVTTTAKVNLYHESRQMLNKGVFIADNDWYSVERGDLSVKSGEEVYFVGPSATLNHGVDFSGISSNLNLTLDTAYIDSEDYVPGTTTWINGVYSIRGGAGLTTITGSDKSDTIFAGTGSTTINARGDNDYISLASAKALVEYASGDGNDFIAGFNANSTLNITDASYSSVKRGDNVILTVGSGKITLEGAASLDNLNITSSDTTGVTVDNSTDNTLITGTAYDDLITNSGRRVTVRALAGDDYIANDIDSSVTVASQVANLIDAGAGNDTIYNHHSYHPTLLGGDGNDSIAVNKGHRIFADGGDGNDTIVGLTTDTTDSSDWAMGGYATILGGDGNDYINPFYSNNATINGGDGNDTIIMMGADSTITGSTGNDQISLGTADSVNVLINYASGDGNDVINGFTANDTVSIDGAKYYSVQSGNDLILTVGNGHMTLRGAATLDDINIIGSYDEAANSIISNSTNASLVTGTDGNDTITNTGARATIQALAGNDSIISDASSVLIYGGAGSDSIYASGRNSTINGGDGSNYVSVTGSQGLLVALNGKTTVNGFNMGFGSGADTVYITGDPAVDYKSGGLTLYEENSNGESLTFAGVTDVAKLYLHYTSTGWTRKEVFIPNGVWYTVEDSDFSSGNGDGIYFVGATSGPNHGIDFSNISRSLNVTLNTDYAAQPQFWVNNIHSIRGGAGNTTITGSDTSDTIIAGRGNTTIDAGGGNDNIALNSSRAVVNYWSNDGSDFITGFNANSTLRILGNSFSSVESGDDVIVSVGSYNVTLDGAASLDSLNIVGTVDGGGSISPETEVYGGGDQTISSYAGQPVVLTTDYRGALFDGNNFVVYSPNGALTLQDVADKVIDLRDSAGNETLKAYTASTAGIIDGRGLAGYEIISGAANGTDIIYAGDDGSMLWGGAGTAADALLGGEGVDTFIAGRNQGMDNIFSAGVEDIVNLNDASLSDIVATAEVEGNKILVGFNTGNVIAVQSSDEVSATFKLADGSTHTYNHATKTWQSA